jgi:alcohol dehydrogenase, propanol-preferring
LAGCTVFVFIKPGDLAG